MAAETKKMTAKTKQMAELASDLESLKKNFDKSIQDKDYKLWQPESLQDVRRRPLIESLQQAVKIWYVNQMIEETTTDLWNIYAPAAEKTYDAAKSYIMSAPLLASTDVKTAIFDDFEDEAEGNLYKCMEKFSKGKKREGEFLQAVYEGDRSFRCKMKPDSGTYERTIKEVSRPLLAMQNFTTRNSDNSYFVDSITKRALSNTKEFDAYAMPIKEYRRMKNVASALRQKLKRATKLQNLPVSSQTAIPHIRGQSSTSSGDHVQVLLNALSAAVQGGTDSRSRVTSRNPSRAASRNPSRAPSRGRSRPRKNKKNKKKKNEMGADQECETEAAAPMTYASGATSWAHFDL
jgi:hypothetical protein